MMAPEGAIQKLREEARHASPTTSTCIEINEAFSCGGLRA